METRFSKPGADIEVQVKGSLTMLSKWYGSFLPVLMKTLSLTDGSIVECGTGIYSTPLLHWFGVLSKRHVSSFDNAREFADLASQYASDSHDVYFVDSYSDVTSPKECDVVLIDNFPMEEREGLIKHFADIAKYIVVHDSNPQMFMNLTKYRFDYDKDAPATSVFSNTVDVSLLQI